MRWVARERMSEADVHPAEQPDEQRQVDMRRYEEARRAGLDQDEATTWAQSGEDVGILRYLVHEHCPPRLIARIVL